MALLAEAKAAGPARVSVMVNVMKASVLYGTLLEGRAIRSWVGELAGCLDVAIGRIDSQDVDPVWAGEAAIALLVRGHGVPVAETTFARLRSWHFPELAVTTPVNRRTIWYHMAVFDPGYATALVGYDAAPPSVPGATFGPDPQARLRYLLLARERGASREEVRPAMNEFLETVGPAAVETCDGVDDDCDGTVDEGCP